MESKFSSSPSESSGRTFSRKNISRVGALAFLFLVALLLVWGAMWQIPRNDPFTTPSLLSWFTQPEPHRAFQAMPMLAKGERSRLVPRGLCTEPSTCGGLSETSAGKLGFTDSNGHLQSAVRLHRSPGTGHLYALSALGSIFVLAEGTQSTWH
jgi:hypothetical protein